MTPLHESLLKDAEKGNFTRTSDMYPSACRGAGRWGEQTYAGERYYGEDISLHLAIDQIRTF